MDKPTILVVDDDAAVRKALLLELQDIYNVECVAMREEAVAAGMGKRFERLKIFLQEGTDPGDYAAAGVELEMAANTVAAAVHRLRQRYRELVRAEISHTVASPQELKEEMRHLFAALSQ